MNLLLTRYEGLKRPVWFIFSGMGSQWPGMGSKLLQFPIISESIQRSHDILKEKGLDLINIINSTDTNIFKNILHSFVGITSIQIALVDFMMVLDITPDGYVGHSVGELGCAYMDGCFTAEETLLAAYYRGLASIETDLIPGYMAAIERMAGLNPKGYNDTNSYFDETEYENRPNNQLGLEDSDEETRERD
ncbi:unnamed protein product [Timema podura]|uniref:Malonyl-CoA:ACP transacylase (MAT) domain-containing protein n=1 Tax=Timema podura TaxID=61482 RepID=A0ABN7NQY3_TIMPD|nr:unnamed protein product [Timema podura]